MCSLPHSLSHTHMHNVLSPTLSVSLTHTHTHAQCALPHTLSLTHTHTHSQCALFHRHSLSHTHTLTHNNNPPTPTQKAQSIVTQWMSVPTVLGSLMETRPPNDMREATRIMGMAQCTSTSNPKIKLPKMAAMRMNPVCTPNAVDLQINGSDQVKCSTQWLHPMSAGDFAPDTPSFSGYRQKVEFSNWLIVIAWMLRCCCCCFLLAQSLTL